MRAGSAPRLLAHPPPRPPPGVGHAHGGKPQAPRSPRADGARVQDRSPELMSKRERMQRFAHSVDQWSEQRPRKSLWQSWMSLPPRTRIVLGLGACAFSFAGIMVSDYLEKEYPARNNRAVSSGAPAEPRLEGARGEDAGAKPRLFSISVVDRS